MREVLIDVTRLVDRRLRGRLPTGVDRVSLEYVKYFLFRAVALIRFAGQWIELSRQESVLAFEILLSARDNSDDRIRKLVLKALGRSLWRDYSSPRFLFNTGHSGLDSTKYVDRLRKSGLRPLFFVHDLIPISHPEYCRIGESEKHRRRMNTVLQCGHGVIANSAATLRDLANYAKFTGYIMPPAAVALLASPHFPEPSNCAALGYPYFLMLGTIEPRKNHWMLLQLWARLVEQLGDASPRLIIVGQRGWECENVIALLERRQILKGFVIERSACDDAELVGLLKHAQALVFPSFAEGFGMPLVEALAFGVPVIASDLPAFREIAGDVPEYVDPLDGKRWGELIVEYALSSSALRKAQSFRIAHFSPPTWSAHFEQVEALMERLSFGSP